MLFNDFFVRFIISHVTFLRTFSSSSYIRRTSLSRISRVPLVHFLRFRHSLEWTMERRYRNARQRVINNSAGGLAATPSTTSETFPATALAITLVEPHIIYVALAPSCNPELFRDSSRRIGQRHASFNSQDRSLDLCSLLQTKILLHFFSVQKKFRKKWNLW